MPYIALQVPQKKSVRILHETETDGARVVDARRHHQEFAVLGQFISLREIPDRTLRLVIASPSENCHSCMLIEKFICPLPHIPTRSITPKGLAPFECASTGSGPRIVRFLSGSATAAASHWLPQG